MIKETLLHRQIHPSWVQNNAISAQAFLTEITVSSLAFLPSEKDKGMLSVYNGEKFTAEESYQHFTKSFISGGVLSVSVIEVQTEELSVIENNTPFDGHTVIDYTSLESNSKIKKKAQKLRNLAIARGWTHKI